MFTKPLQKRQKNSALCGNSGCASIQPMKDSSSKMPKFIAASALLHALLVPAVYKAFALEKPALKKYDQNSPVEIELLPPEPKGKFVDIEDDAPSSETPPDTNFISDKNRRVKTQTQARNTSTFPQKSSAAKEISPLEGGVKYTRSDIPKHSGDYITPLMESAGKTRKLDLSLPRKFLSDLSSSPRNYLPEIAYGEQTLLNTREFAYASFFKKMKRSLEMVWNPMPIVRRLPRKKPLLITTLKIVLRPDGSLDHVKIIRSSGIKELDHEAARAVRQAAPFINPPKGLIKNGKIVIDAWQFIISTRLTL